MADIELRRLWTIDGAASQKDGVPRRIWDLIMAANPPETTLEFRQVNMWWRANSPEIFIQTRLERGMPLVGSIYVQDYGTSLVISRVVVEPDSMARFKWMAAGAFEHLIDRAITTVVAEERGVEVTERGEKSDQTGG